ncbi:MAG: hypothetical protein A2Z03_03900 [Chloroflexi bacterium RBG_16_56_8]|nr:MAG: hypothetical protein A2Z03_03900 [Chloroflexi bacterium RBG_16_56_8]
MEDDILKVNILAITVAGLLMLLTGLFLYVFRDLVSKNVRFFLPIPPLGVAAYVFVFNLFAHYNGTLPSDHWITIREMLSSALISGVVFCAFIVANVIITNWLKGLL